MKKAKTIAKWLIEEYPPFFPIDEEALINDIQKNIIEGWIPYILWYNENHEKKITFPTDPQEFIERVFHKSIEKCSITPPKIGESVKDYLKNSKKGV